VQKLIQADHPVKAFRQQ